MVQGKAAVLKIIGKLLVCRREAAFPTRWQMTPLSSQRINSTGYPCAHLGEDCFALIYVKRKRVDEKLYGGSFTCLNIRAMHIEVMNLL